MDHNQEFYFHSSLTGSRCLAVVEHSVVVENQGGSLLSEHAIGWTYLKVFDRGALPLRDSADSGSVRDSGRDVQHMEIYHGSPIALLQPELTMPLERSAYLQRSKADLNYTLKSHKAMRSVMHLLPADVFMTCNTPWPGLLPARESSRSAQLLMCPLAKPDARYLQTSCKLSTMAIKVTMPASLESETARAAYASMLTSLHGGAKAASIPSKVTTGTRRLLLGLHNSHILCADKSALNSREPLPVSSPDGRIVGPPPGSIVAPKVLHLEEDVRKSP